MNRISDAMIAAVIFDDYNFGTMKDATERTKASLELARKRDTATREGGSVIVAAFQCRACGGANEIARDSLHGRHYPCEYCSAVARF